MVTSPIQFYPGGTFIDPVAELDALLMMDPARDDAPLFRDPNANKPLSVKILRVAVKQIAHAAGLHPGFFLELIASGES